MNGRQIIVAGGVVAIAASLCAGQTTLRRAVIGAGGGSVVNSTMTHRVSFTFGQPVVGSFTGTIHAINAGFWVPGTRRCPADFDDGTFTGTPDGGVTIDDLLFYLFLFENGDVRADVDDGSGTGTLDGGVTIDDLLYFLARFEGGC